ncbi:hypothetical protein G2W53_020666 [Senna tora]|uniref:Uncharacterized protein n=1 Tax=Senna tora TaxID=362788 RepID=A0A834THX5_9FABA|nr:hypothetical protein G2W53_020666 [Senna tora]
MGKLKCATLITEVAPPRFVSVTRRRMKKLLDTIAEEDTDFGAHKCLCSSTCSSLCLSQKPVFSN